MKISAKTDYACRALLELSLHWPHSTPLQIGEIARNQKIPIKFLTHILIQLKQMGYVESVRGQRGGYLLAKPPREITVHEVIDAFHEMKRVPLRTNISLKTTDVFENIWRGADNVIAGFFAKITFEEICQRKRNLTRIPMYTI